ncbi:MAG: ABC transporter ATP-binding protein [Candidatus Caenarcaniphilales bacterium]|nr:ABC transporter ATP-binding protein [Candidatus Caenarcaniphilales bacterium]
MSKEIAVKFEEVSKTYYKGLKAIQLRRLLIDLLKPKTSEEKIIQSLEPVSFEINKGEVVGIIGKNGSGKSTTLKLIAGISHPTTGKITINGKITTMLSLGAGFHPDFTGRENVFLNGTLFGMSNYYLHSRLQSIIEFSELGAKIDEPVRTYSAGMLSRLGFSVAIQTQPEILLIDEVLAVGDNAFQEKCLAKFEEIKKSAETTIILVTHSMEQVTKHCQKAIWINKGKLMGVGEPDEIVDKYKALPVSS